MHSLYYTKVQLGSPPKEFHVQIDTGSDVLWVSCNTCSGCPESSGLHVSETHFPYILPLSIVCMPYWKPNVLFDVFQQIPLNFFDPGSSSTASPVPCSDQRCSIGIQSSDSGCSTQSNLCSYTFQYGDGSGTSGYYISDLMSFDTIVGNSMTANSTARILFGYPMITINILRKFDWKSNLYYIGNLENYSLFIYLSCIVACLSKLILALMMDLK